MRRAVPLLLLALAGVLGAAPAPQPVVCLLVGPGQVAGESLEVRSGAVELRGPGGAVRRPLADFRELRWTGRTPTEPLPAPALRLWGSEGSVLNVASLAGGAAPETVDLAGAGWRAAGVPLAAIRAVAARSFLLTATGPDAEELRSLRESPPVGEDRLRAYTDGGTDLLSGVVTALDAGGLRLALAGGERAVPWDGLAWVVLAPSQLGARPAGRLHTIELADGSRVRAEAFEWQDGAVAARALGGRFTIEPDALVAVTVASDRYAYLSDLEPSAVETEPQLDVVWPPRMDAAVSGEPIRLGGVAYARGIGMHPRTVMSFRLDGAYERLYATVGVDDAAEGRGSAVFRVLADGREVVSVGPLTGGDPPQELAADVAGARTVTLVADFGDPLAVAGNLADWADARVVRETGQPAAAEE